MGLVEPDLGIYARVIHIPILNEKDNHVFSFCNIYLHPLIVGFENVMQKTTY
jgi:hypothetical protein